MRRTFATCALAWMLFGGGFAISADAQARTWLVSPGGAEATTLSLQAALDIAAPGDIVELVPGRYDDWALQDSGWTRLMIGFIESSGLTIRGQDRETTIIGPSEPHVRRNDDPLGFQMGLGTMETTIENLTFENLRDAFSSVGSFTVHDVTFRDCYMAMNLTEVVGAWIYDCEFEGNYEGIFATYSEDLRVERCTFDQTASGCYFSDASWNMQVVDCSFTGARVGVTFYRGAQGSISSSVFECEHYGVVALDYTDVELNDCVIRNGDVSVQASKAGFLHGRRNRFLANEYRTLHFHTQGQAWFRDCVIAPSPTGVTVELQFYRDPSQPTVIDLRYNDWRTDDPDVVEASILDGVDDLTVYGTVSYLPMNAVRVGTESTSMSRLKSMYLPPRDHP